jgi:small-conductance mechanosensitive channel
VVVKDCGTCVRDPNKRRCPFGCKDRGYRRWKIRPSIAKLQSEHKQLKEDFDTAYKELEWERKRADELQEQLERLKQQSMVLSESRYELADEAELLQDQLRRKDEQIAKFTESQARVQVRLKGQRDLAKRKVHKLEAQLKECVDVLTKIDQFFDNADHCEYPGCPNMIPDKIWDLIDPLLADLNKLKRGGIDG